ncbi:MAG: NAD(P)H-dependent glycerol-3-phosphate dehydrogenase [Verrucomicrobiota bacterium]|jgi:glycerol-3-phosphate dehydrogenase (NAD(P)+)
MNVTVLGAGAWGTALANLLCQNGNAVTLWGHNAGHLQSVQRAGSNAVYLPGIPLSPELKYEPDLGLAVAPAECLVVAVPSKFLREVTARIPGFSGIAVSVTKGIEDQTGLTMSGILKATMPACTAAALSGPSFALEVARGIPGAIVAAHPEPLVAKRIQRLFHCPTFRVYSSGDLLGVELGGALKNVVAIAAGVGDGLGYGDNTKAALITRAMAEIRRLGVACGACADTFSGLSGLGDLTGTCFSRLSRNRNFGERVGRGEKVDEILAGTRAVVEGYPTARSAHHLAGRLGSQTPIVREVYAMLYENKDIRQAVQSLMGRDMKPED